MIKDLYNTTHPMESGKSIFLPFGEWDYDGRCRQRLDHAHGEAIANELNARVDRGEPGIPVYQGHPDVPQLASRYPDKGALGWVTKIELVNEGGKDGLRLSVEWDRDPGKGFRWFSPYWIANEREGNCHIVAEIASVGLVNNPNIPEFRLANELQGGSKGCAMPQKLVDLAKRFDERKGLANVVDANGAGHGDDGRFDGSGSGGGASGGSSYGKKLVATRQAAVDAAQKTFDEAKFRGTATKAERDRYMSELAALFDARKNK